MSLFGQRENQFDQLSLDMTGMSSNYTSESLCQRFWLRAVTCLRDSQHVDPYYDCKSRLADFNECSTRRKQHIWVMRESIASLRNEQKFRKWLRDYDEKFGHPPLLEAVDKIKAKVEEEGGIDILNPTHFKDPDMWLAGDAKKN